MTSYPLISKSLARLAVAAVAAAGLATFSVSDAKAASASFDAKADIVAAIGITKTADLDFGGVVSGTAGSVVIATGGARTCNTVTCADSATIAAAAFNVTGTGSLAYAITLPANADIITGAGDTASKKMNVGTFTDSKSGSGTLSSGTDSFTVGATLTVASTNIAGAYTGSFSVTVEYN